MDPASLQPILDEFWRRAEARGAVMHEDECQAQRLSTGADTHGGCGKTRMGFTYTKEGGGTGSIGVCAVGDMAYLFPRFN